MRDPNWSPHAALEDWETVRSPSNMENDVRNGLRWIESKERHRQYALNSIPSFVFSICIVAIGSIRVSRPWGTEAYLNPRYGDQHPRVANFIFHFAFRSDTNRILIHIPSTIYIYMLITIKSPKGPRRLTLVNLFFFCLLRPLLRSLCIVVLRLVILYWSAHGGWHRAWVSFIMAFTSELCEICIKNPLHRMRL